MLSVALIGPDGAGKTTVIHRLEHAFPVPVKVLYMGINPDASNHMLPTTRLLQRVRRLSGRPTAKGGPRDPNKTRTRPRGRVVGLAYGLKSTLSLANRMAEEWYRQGLAWGYQRRGCIVLFDRHYFLDYYSYDIMTDGRPRPLSRRIHGFMLSRLYPKPDLVVYLDAPAEVLYARKREGSVSLLEERRQAYLQVADQVPAFHIVDATRPIDEVTETAREVIMDHYRRRLGTPRESLDAA